MKEKNGTEENKLRNPEGRSVLVATMITAFISTFMGSSLNLSIPSIEHYFAVNAATINWVISAYTIAVAAMSLPLGKLADIKGRRKVFLTGIGGFGVSSILCIFSVNIEMLIFLRSLQGMCAAMMFSTNNAILISSFPHSVQGKVLGMSVSATYVGLMMGPVLGGILNNSFGWKSIFITASIIAVTAFIVSFKNIPVKVQEKKKVSDLSGVVLYIAAIGLSLYGVTNMTVSDSAKVIFAVGVGTIVFFFLHESRTENPVLKVSMFTQSRVFTLSNLAALLNYSATFAISYSVSLYLQLVKGFPSNKAGMILIAMPAVQALLSPIMGSLSDRIAPYKLASTGMGFCALALFMLSRVSTDTHLAFIILPLLTAGFGFSMFSSPNNNAIMNCVEQKDYGVANSIIATMRTYGQSLGIGGLNIITGIVLGTASLEEAAIDDIVRLIRTAFGVFIWVCMLGLAFSLARNGEKKAE